MAHRYPVKIIGILSAIVAALFFSGKYGETLRNFVKEEFGAKPFAEDVLADHSFNGPGPQPEPPPPSCASVYCAGCGNTSMASLQCTAACSLCVC
jgi:hypothetical protein